MIMAVISSLPMPNAGSLIPRKCASGFCGFLIYGHRRLTAARRRAGAGAHRFSILDHDMSIYVLGDDYSGGDFDSVIEAVRKLNTGGARINAINFINPSATTDRFSILMREIALENHGTLITM